VAGLIPFISEVRNSFICVLVNTPELVLAIVPVNVSIPLWVLLPMKELAAFKLGAAIHVLAGPH
jgi:hypothetical protein